MKPGDRILDIGAGTVVYSFHFDNLGYKVDAIELRDANCQVIKSKMSSDCKINLVQGNALDLSAYENESFDVVLLFVPLFHLISSMDRDRVIKEAMRILKDNGTLFVSFINHDFIHMSETMYNHNWFADGSYNKENFRIDDFPFVFFNLEEGREMLISNGLSIEKEIGSDGMSELLAEKINLMDDVAYERYLACHMKNCEDAYMLKSTNHFLFQCKK